jgi:hypothetical protein
VLQRCSERQQGSDARNARPREFEGRHAQLRKEARERAPQTNVRRSREQFVYQQRLATFAPDWHALAREVRLAPTTPARNA